MTIWEITKAALDTVGLPVAGNQMISATPATLPDQYLVYQMISDPPAQHADDEEKLRRYRMQVSFYSRSGLTTVPAQVEAAMKAAGFTRSPGRELPYNNATRHFGLVMDFNYLEDLTDGN